MNPPAPNADTVIAHIVRLNRPLLTAGEVAEALRLSKGTVYALFREGELKGSDYGRGTDKAWSNVRISRRSLAEYALKTSTEEPEDITSLVELIKQLLTDLPDRDVMKIGHATMRVIQDRAQAARLNAPQPAELELEGDGKAD